MKPEKNSTCLSSKVIETKLIDWKSLQFLQQDNFKDLCTDDKLKLKNSLVSNAFIQPFYVWQDETCVLFCLDGKHRTIVLNELIADGHPIPDLLPATFVDCKDRAEAAKLVLIFSSAYAKVTQSGLDDFMKLYDLELVDLEDQISIPGLVIQSFEPIPTDLDGIAHDKPASMKITFQSAADLESALPIIETALKEKYPSALISVSAGEL
jgi:hypothetical protein